MKSAILYSIFNFIPLICTGVFVGIALATSLVSVPKMKNDTLTKDQLLSFWRHDFKATAPIQIALVCVSTICLIVSAFFFMPTFFALIGCGLLLMTMPWTLFVLMPINRQLLSDQVMKDVPLNFVQSFINKWSLLHIPRILFSLAAFIFFYLAIVIPIVKTIF